MQFNITANFTISKSIGCILAESHQEAYSKGKLLPEFEKMKKELLEQYGKSLTQSYVESYCIGEEC